MDAVNENNLEVVKIVPNPEELQISSRLNQCSVKCPENGCNYVAVNSSLLGLHKAQVHNIKHIPVLGKVYHYHCPVADCKFSPQSLKYFRSLDIARTHYMKIHSEKKFLCSKCEKHFGLERDCQRHEKECGETFNCLDCGKMYTNKAALIRHCDYNRHKKPDYTFKTKIVKEKISPKDGNKKKTPATPMKTPAFILPKSALPVLLTPAPLKQQSLEIQTDSLGAQLFLTKLMSEHSVSQAVQTSVRENETKSAAIQTNPDGNPYISPNPSKISKLSIAMQTLKTDVSKINGNLCAAQTQTGEFILKNAMLVADIPVVKVCKSTQKYGARAMKGKRKPKVICSTKSHTSTVLAETKMNCNVDSNYFPNPALFGQMLSTEKEMEIELDKSLDDYMATMSTQTTLSCVSEDCVSQFRDLFSGARLQDCHTQTHRVAGPCQIVQPSSDQVSQTNLCAVSSDQITQTAKSAGSSASYVSGFLPCQDSHTQTNTYQSDFSSINSSHTQTLISTLFNVAEVQDQGTTCDGLLDFSVDNFSSNTSIQNDVLAHHLDTPKHRFQSPYSEDNSRISQNVFISNQVRTCQVDALTSSQSTDMLEDYLMNEIDIPTNSHPTNVQYSDHKAINHADQAICMETQTFGSLGMDSMTQTIDDLVWDIGTQTVEDIVTDMMTQTGDDLLEYLTNDSQTQTLDDFYDQLSAWGESGDLSDGRQNTSLLRLGSSSQITSLLPGDNASTQTAGDFDSQDLSFSSNSFVGPWNSPSSNSEEENQNYSDYPTKWDYAHGSRQDKMHCDGDVSERATRNHFDSVTFPLESASDRINTAECFKETETSETQTVFDPIFSYFDTADVLFQAPKPTRYLESSHTQTAFDPMLSSVTSYDGGLVYSNKETSETQTAMEIESMVSRETAQCQTPWEDTLTSETQTNDAIFLDYHFPTNFDTRCVSRKRPDPYLTDSFTQTNMDRNTQTTTLVQLSDV